MKRDLREYAKQTDRRLIIGGILLLFLVGGGLIWFFYGTGGWGLAMTCLLAGLAPVVILILLFKAIEWIMNSARPK